MNMKRMLTSLLGAALLSGVAMVPQASLAQEKTRMAEQFQKVKPERHPKIRQAVNALEAAKFELEHADHDFGGHRREAIESVDQAMKQLRLAIQFDKY